ncbi:hypothetical protein OSCT_0330 [Oscillochloris trichoides DG-6]|uniref:Uncharacterized protein n=1 Tax=Oscillochloris trichoides DG-6 TaxID=765420 RepID=E1IAH9_9CHLR|nr:hypothetical protein OSCT_0330 [Oscillochloris trichoides DG-6]
MRLRHRFNPPGGFGAFGTTAPYFHDGSAASFNPPGGFGAFGTQTKGGRRCVVQTVSIRRADLGLLELFRISHVETFLAVSIRRADLGLLERGAFQGIKPSHGNVSIRRADLGLLELCGRSLWRGRRPSKFQSAGRIWGFWNWFQRGTNPLLSKIRFNPPGGFGAFGTWNHAHAVLGHPLLEFQSAGRIWGFWNGCHGAPNVAAHHWFQSAGRIWGFWNSPSSIVATRITLVSIRRADLGLLEHRCIRRDVGRGRSVSIRRADLGLLEPWAIRPTGLSRRRFNPPGGFGAFGTELFDKQIAKAILVSIRRADLGLLEPP